ncbi:hypothetical protein [Kribbella sp. NPDC055071]
MIRRTLILIAALLAVAALGTTPAHAGGPTSVLLSAPPHVVAVGYEDKAYGELQRLTDTSATRPDPGTERHDAGHFVRATWMIHDMSVWRIDIIYPDAPGGPWIATSESYDGNVDSIKPVWHAAVDPIALVKLLGTLKLLPGQHNGEPWYGDPTAGPDNGFVPSTGDPVPTAQPESAVGSTTDSVTTPQVATPQPATTGVLTGWRWIIPGFLVGVAVAVVAIRLLPKRRWELIDVEQ